MSQPSRLRLSDVATIHQVVHECRELWADPAAWRQHLVQGAAQVTGMAVGHYIEFTTSQSPGNPRVLCSADVGWRDESMRAIYAAASAVHPNAFKFFLGSERFLPQLEAGKPVVALRTEMCPDAQWYQSVVFNQWRRPACVDDHVMSAIRRGDGGFAVLDVNQDVAEARPTSRTKRQLALLHRLIDPLIGSELATESQRSMHGLTPRLRATLEWLLAGESEKRIAARLGVRQPTVHVYVGKIYRHFNVQSRAELMAFFLRRRPNSC